MNYSAVRKKEVYKTIPVINGKEGERERKESVYSAMLKVANVEGVLELEKISKTTMTTTKHQQLPG